LRTLTFCERDEVRRRRRIGIAERRSDGEGPWERRGGVGGEREELF
jgi:hypothetical protein